MGSGPTHPAIAAAFDLSGRVAVVTGAAGGLGLAHARALGQAGATVVLTDVRPPDEAVDALRSESIDAVGAVLDVTDRGAVEAMADAVTGRRERLDVWVNNAAVIGDATPATLTEDELDRVMAVNFKGVVFGSQAAARHMVPAGRGSIVNITSGAVDVPMAWVGAYSASKAAAHQFSRSLALELAGHGVRVNTVAPGWVLTPMNERHIRSADGNVTDEARAALTSERVTGIPLRRAGQPEDIALAVLYLACDASSFVTGTTIRPNGGMTMPW